MQLAPSSNFFSGVPVRDLLQKIDFHTSHQDEQIALEMLFGLSHDSTQARRSSHLTHSTQQGHQIRFPLRDRVKRALRKIAERAARHIDFDSSVDVLENDELSLEFLKFIPQVKVRRVTRTEQASTESWLSVEELLILRQLQESDPCIDDLHRASQQRIYSGDYRTAHQILSAIPSTRQNGCIHYSLGLCTNFFGRTVESERHFKLALQSDDVHTRIGAQYMIAMLYLRMHPVDRQDLRVAEEALENAHDCIRNEADIHDRTFHRVFNRNGFALCLFRRGRTQEALTLLENGIADLSLHSAGSRALHKSVLIYNSAQCLRALGRHEECEDKLDELLEIDPLFPEYHLEKAKSQLDQGKKPQALAAIDQAERLDAFIPELHALKGFAHLERGDLASAAAAYRRAVDLDPDSAPLRMDLEYCLSHLESSTGEQV